MVLLSMRICTEEVKVVILSRFQRSVRILIVAVKCADPEWGKTIVVISSGLNNEYLVLVIWLLE